MQPSESSPPDPPSFRLKVPVGGQGPVDGQVSADASLPDESLMAPPVSTSTPAPIALASESQRSTAPPDDKTVISSRLPGGESAPPAIATPQHLGQSLLGKRLGHYELIEFVGGGGMGAVFRATDDRLGRTVAVKVLSRDHTDEDTIRRFRNEAQSAARLDHPNIARVHDVGEDHGWNFIVFEFIEGINLRDMVEANGPLPLADALFYTLQVAEALSHSSSRDVVHRDIKPSNVLVTFDGSVKVVDMGLARLHQVETSSEDLTASGVTLGTFDYISPEQARDPRSADVRSDIYSLGCTLYYMLSGRPPFPDGTALQKLLRHNADEPPDVRLLRPDLAPSVSGLLAKMLSKRPSQRQQTAIDLTHDIAALAEQLGLSGVVRSRQILVAPRPVGPQLWATALQVAVAAIVLCVALVAIDAWLPRMSSADGLVLRPKTMPRTETAADTDVPASASTFAGSNSNPAEVGPPPDRPFPQVGSAPAANRLTVSNSAPGTADLVVLPGNGAAALEPSTDGSDVTELQGTALAFTETAASLGPPPLSAAIGLPATAGVAAAIGPSTDAPSAPVIKIKRLVVARQPPTVVPADTVYQRTLAAACLRAAELGLSEIDLEWTGPLVESPLEITNPRLTLRAAVGYRPLIVFRPQVSESAASRQMIRFTAGASSRLTIYGVDLWLELPPEPASGWSLVALRPGQTLDLASCVLTVQDGDAASSPVHDQVAMITVHPRQTTDTMAMEPTGAMAVSTTVLIDSTIARGEASFISLAEDSPLSLNWTQGLLVTPQRLLATTGSAASPKSFDRINLTLENVTAACRQGLYVMNRRRGAGYHFGLDVAASHCIFMTDVDAPLFDFVGVQSVADSDLQCEGEFNRYPPRPDVTFLRVTTPPPNARETTFDLKDRGAWSRESQPRPLDQWRMSPPADRPAHAQSKEAYQPPPEAVIDAGFDPTRLPSIQPIASTETSEPARAPSSAPAVGPPPDGSRAAGVSSEAQTPLERLP